MVSKIVEHGVVLIVRLGTFEDIAAVVKEAVDSGIQAIEITSNTPGYLSGIKESKLAYPNVLIGAGTVVDCDIAQQAIDAGADFLVTPNTSQHIVELAHSNDIPVLMGALTPTEIADALGFGADIIKLFPSSALGSNYLKSLVNGPFNEARFFPVGGVSESNIQEWLEAGAAGVGIGGSIVRPLLTDKERYDFSERCKAILAKVSL
ncbi:bifunctional 4-hydroxy-2-oxoglutarate aldolase/2-dehydro-3-deoxy-phosphogluconate aldolase [Thalassotalea euphylliae]|uniref:bifunctional 4-hydroxy-2-oxoglutarate aldolase/2-dehydro-3-deoxy-phosphogluconate aldolase n=1 Tax=Thalassotalea euphylliae TaxID=1655234 RepID=UPI0036420FDB